MHFLNAHRIRLIMIALVVVLLWQIFRSWPGDDQEKWVKFVVLDKNSTFQQK